MSRIFCFLFLLNFLFFACKNENKVKTNNSKVIVLSKKDSIKLEDYKSKAFSLPLSSQARQHYLDSALQTKPDYAYLWQQKSMPLYKARKYSLGKPFLEKAAFYNPDKYLDYSAFMKCIFSKEYEESTKEFLEYKKRFGDSYVMDHTYNFYIGLNYLQLNKFKQAKEYLLKSKTQQFADFPKDNPEEACHFLDWFYLGIADYELGNYSEAIQSFDKSLKVYTVFADAMYYKAFCLDKLGENEEANTLLKKAYANKSSSIVEDNSYYEIYPYQIFHKLQH